MTSHPQAAIAAHQPSRWTASAASLQRVERILFALTVMAAAGMMWLAPHLPMSDLAQHAGQVALWRDLLTGQSPWTEFVRINLMTPYLIGYGLMLPLSFVFSMETTTRIAVTLGFLGFVAVARGLRREFGSDKRLDWLFLLSFFGHAWKWGFLTYLVASPVGLIFLLLAHRNSSQPSPWRAVLLAATGSLLLFCHGLVFLVMVSLGGLLALAMTWENWPKSLALRLLPFVWLVALALGFRLATADIQGAFQMEGFAYGLPLPQRPGALLVWLTDMDTFALYLPLASIAVLMYPKFLRLQANSRPVLVLVGGFVVLLAIVPTDGFSTGLLFPRLALFVPVMLALAFRATPEPGGANGRNMACQSMAILAIWSILAIQGSRIAAFAKESKPFETILAAAEPGKRGLSLIFALGSEAAANDNIYMHYPAWYQADKHGFVDFNFAWFPPQIVRFKPEADPGLIADSGWNARNFSFASIDPTLYIYYFVRGSNAQVENLRRISPCRLEIKAADSGWYLLEQFDCPAQSGTGRAR